MFSLSGQSINPIYNACLDYDIRIVDTRHEQAAAFMADAWGRMTGQPGVCVFTKGPGHTNCITGLASAYLAESPVVCISGGSELSLLDMGNIQEIDQIGLVRPVTKWARLIATPNRVPEYLSKAFSEATACRPGPVHLSVPIDIIKEKVEDKHLCFHRPEGGGKHPQVLPEPELIKEALNILARARRPVVIAGKELNWVDVQEELQGFIETCQFPLFTTEAVWGIVPDDHPLCFGLPGGILARVTKDLGGIDAALILGQRLDYSLNYGKPPIFPRSCQIIQANLTEPDLDGNRGVVVGIVGDARSVLVEFRKEAEKKGLRGSKEWIQVLNQVYQAGGKRWEMLENSDAVPIHPLRLIKEIRSFIERDATIVLDGGDIYLWGLRGFQALHRENILTFGPLGQLGIGVPFAMAAKIHRPEAKVMVLTGDGSFGYQAMEFDTALRHDIPIVCVIANNGAWGMIRNAQIKDYGEKRIIGSELRRSRYDKIVECLGGYGKLVERPAEIRRALEEAFASGLPACINVMTS